MQTSIFGAATFAAVLLSGTLQRAIDDGGNTFNSKPVDAQQRTNMLDMIEDGLKKGGLGIGFPLGYYQIADSDDILKAAMLAKTYNSFISSHIRFLSVTEPSGYLGVIEMLSDANLALRAVSTASRPGYVANQDPGGARYALSGAGAGHESGG
ncbi:MAG: hypothetical protein WBV71_02295 [Roseobacter sp.]